MIIYNLILIYRLSRMREGDPQIDFGHGYATKSFPYERMSGDKPVALTMLIGGAS